jgi:hypothetical protein
VGTLSLLGKEFVSFNGGEERKGKGEIRTSDKLRKLPYVSFLLSYLPISDRLVAQLQEIAFSQEIHNMNTAYFWTLSNVLSFT